MWCQYVYEPSLLSLERIIQRNQKLNQYNNNDSSHSTPMVTCAPWKPVSTKNVEPKSVFITPDTQKFRLDSLAFLRLTKMK